MIISEIDTKNFAKEKPFPKLMFNNDIIVLFSKEEEGMIVHSNDIDYRIGYFKDTWAMEFFEDFNERLILKNE